MKKKTSFWELTKFKVIVAAVLTSVLIGYAQSELFYSVDWLIYILAPPFLLYFPLPPGDWDLLLVPLSVGLYYFIACVIEKYIGKQTKKTRGIKKKSFWTFTKFKVWTAIILFLVIVGPISINDDWFFAAPWIWYILSPPFLLELVDLEVLELPLVFLWFYFIACIIEKYKK